MTTRISGLRRVAAVSVLLIGSALASLGAQSANAAHRWDAWLGCWQASVPAEPSAAAALPRVCVAPTSTPTAIELTTTQNGKVVSRDTIDASGQSRAVSLEDCKGAKTARWSSDARRVYLHSELTCPGNLERTSTGILAITPTGDWLDVQTVSAGGNTGVRVLRYHDVTDSSTLRASVSRLTISTARAAAGGTLAVADIAEASKQVDTAAVQAWIVERGVKFDLGASQLMALADAGVPGSVTDVMIGVSYPEHFALRQRPTGSLASASDLSPMDSARIASQYAYDRCYGSLWYSTGFYDPCGSRYGYGYGRYGYGAFGYGLYGYNPYTGYYGSNYGYGYPVGGIYYTGAPVVVVRGQEAQHGTLVKGQGYTRGGGTAPARSEYGGRESSGGSSASSGSGSSGSGSSSSSGSSGSSGSSSGGRTAHPRPPR